MFDLILQLPLLVGYSRETIFFFWFEQTVDFGTFDQQTSEYSRFCLLIFANNKAIRDKVIFSIMTFLNLQIGQHFPNTLFLQLFANNMAYIRKIERTDNIIFLFVCVHVCFRFSLSPCHYFPGKATDKPIFAAILL